VSESFTWTDGDRLVRFGDGSVSEAPRLLSGRGFGEYTLLTTERAADQAAPLAAGAAAVLHVPHGPVPEAAAAVRADVGGRPLVALGGGRVIDAAKALGGADGLPVAAIPTTLSGAPMTPFHRMPAGVEQWNLVRPLLVIADPLVMASQPMPDLAASAMNAMAHAVEAVYGPNGSPVTRMAALRAVDLFESALDGADPMREDLALAAVLAGYAVGSAGFAVHHAVCQTTVRVLGTPHAQTNAVMLPHSVAFVAARAPDALHGIDPERVAAAAARAGVTTLGELGVREGQIASVAEAAARHPAMGKTPGGAPTVAELTGFIGGAL
jgi:alcohol dehydrogenase class IV